MRCDAVCGGGVQQGTMLLAPLSARFQSLSLLPTIKLDSSGADSWVGGFVYILGVWVSPTKSPVSLGVSPTAASTPTGVFYQSFDALFPCTEVLGFEVCLTPQLFLPIYLHSNVGPPSPQSAVLLAPPAAALPRVLSAPAACLCPSSQSG